MLLREERELVAEYGRRMSADHLSTGTSGNLSIYDPERGLMAISPSGMAYSAIRPEDVVVTDLNAKLVEGTRRPSSEWALHTELYRRKPDIRAVVHTHSVYCTTFAVLGQPLRAVHYAIGDARTDEVPCAPYALYGTEELARAAAERCGAGRAVLLANHGLVVCGGSMEEAYSLACSMEFVAEVQYRAACVGEANVLSRSQMAQVLEKFKTYGQPK